MDADEFRRRREARIIAHWHATRFAGIKERSQPEPPPIIDDVELTRLQHEATARAARNWDPAEWDEMPSLGWRSISDVITDAVETFVDIGPNKGKFLGPAYLTEYLRSEHWRGMRERMLLRAGGYCMGCRRRFPDRALDVHHVTYRNLGEEREDELRVLCRECHQIEHGRTF